MSALLWSIPYFGGLAFYPVSLIFPVSKRKRSWLGWHFTVLAIVTSLAWGFVAYCYVAYPRDWLHSLLVPFVVGALGIVIGLGIAFIRAR